MQCTVSFFCLCACRFVCQFLKKISVASSLFICDVDSFLCNHNPQTAVPFQFLCPRLKSVAWEHRLIAWGPGWGQGEESCFIYSVPQNDALWKYNCATYFFLSPSPTSTEGRREKKADSGKGVDRETCLWLALQCVCLKKKKNQEKCRSAAIINVPGLIAPLYILCIISQ